MTHKPIDQMTSAEVDIKSQSIGKWATWIIVLMVFAGSVVYGLWLDRNLEDAHAMRDALFQIVHSESEAFILADSRGTILQWSPGAAEVYGMDASQAIGGNAESLIPPEMRAQHRQKMARASARGGVSKGVVIIRCHSLHASGTRFPSVITIRSIRDHRGEVMYLINGKRAEDVQITDLGGT